ncbi:MAG: FUSC family protein [Acidobacteriaceae bacterium]|jgi:multidrug resistance protein MdtO
MAKTLSRDVVIFRSLQAELAPFPGRFAGSLRDTLGILLALVLTMTLRVQGIGLALALLFQLQRDRPGMTLRSAAQMLLGAAAACAATIFWAQLTDGTDFARYVGLILGIFIAAFGMATTSIPSFFSMFGFYGFVDLAAWDTHRSPNAIVTSSLYGIASLAIVMLSAVAVEYLFGSRHPAEELDREMYKNLTLLARFFHFLAQDPATQNPEQLRLLHSPLVQAANLSDVRMGELYDRVHNANPTLAGVPLGIRYRIGLLSRVLEKSALIGFNTGPKRSRCDQASCAVIAAQCDQLLAGCTPGSSPLPSESLSASAPTWLIEIHTELQQYAASCASPETIAQRADVHTRRFRPSFRLFMPGALESDVNTIYALKLTLAATLCYTVYNAIAWPGILTCVITVLFTGLSPTGQMKQRQIYRFFGTAVGGALAIAAEALLFPNMDSITSLVLVVAAVGFAAGWVLRSPHMGSVGTQIGFAFFLTTLQGFGATTRIAVARDRVIGVALGSLVMWFVFDQLWPIRTSQALTQILLHIRQAARQLNQGDVREDPENFALTLSRLRVAVSMDLANTQLLESGAYFEFGRDQLRELIQSRRLVRKIETAASEFYSEALRHTNDATPRNDATQSGSAITTEPATS